MAFADSSVGGLFFGMLSLAKPARLAAQAPSGYASLVTYGHRSWASTGEASGVLHMEGDMQPPRYHVGVIVAGMRAIGYAAVVEPRVHTLNPVARVGADGTLTYPGEAESQPELF